MVHGMLLNFVGLRHVKSRVVVELQGSGLGVTWRLKA